MMGTQGEMNAHIQSMLTGIANTSLFLHKYPINIYIIAHNYQLFTIPSFTFAVYFNKT